MPGTLIVRDPTIIVELMKDVARILELGGHRCPASAERYDEFQKILDAGQMCGAPCLKAINEVGVMRYDDPRLCTVVREIAVGITHVGQVAGSPPEGVVTARL